MRSWMRIPGILLWLTILWVALWGEISWGNVLGGIAIALVVVASSRLDRVSLRPTQVRPLWAVAYVATVAWQLVVSNVRLALEVLTPSDGTRTAIVAVPIRGGSDAVVNLVANSITLTPGTMTVDVRRHDAERDEGRDDDGADDDVAPGVTLYVHGIFAEDVESVRGDVLRLEALALRAFGTAREAELARADVERHDRARAEAAPPAASGGRP